MKQMEFKIRAGDWGIDFDSWHESNDIRAIYMDIPDMNKHIGDMRFYMPDI